MKKSSRSHSLRLAALATAVALLSPVAQAQDSGWYVGAGLGESDAEFKYHEILDSMRNSGLIPTYLNGDDQDFAGKVFGGYNFNRFFGLEASYYNFGNFGFNSPQWPNGSFSGRSRGDGIALDLVGTLPVSERLSAFAKVGVHETKLYESFSPGPGASGFNRGTHKDTDGKYGVGVQYNLNDNFSLRAEAERFHIGYSNIIDDNVDMYTIGFVARFGSRPEPVAQPEPEPQPRPTPPPPPPPPPEPVTVTLSADALFDFDSADLSTAGRQELDVLVEDLRGLDYEVLIVTGHTDRIGPAEYNDGLSERRAEAVSEYLVGSGVPSGDIRTSGVGSDNPVTSPSDCEGPVTNALIACLQPDRRVEVEVSGTREE